MKVVLLAAASSIHTLRWANGLAARGIEVHLVSLHETTLNLNRGVNLHILKNRTPLGYVLAMFELKRLLNKIQPDLINVHYATGYGLLARLVNVKPVLLSLWGSDVYDFPEKSVLHRWLLRGNLKTADAIASTSQCMASKMTETFVHENVFITPFGIDEQLFSPLDKPDDLKNYIVLGTVKTLKYIYGIDILICAFAKAWKKLGKPDNLVLEISGGGPDFDVLRDLAKSLGVLNQISFHGEVEHSRVPYMLNRLDIYCAFSRAESFGVAILEASACEKPTITSDADGFIEVTVHEKTGLVVNQGNVNGFADAMLKLIQNKQLRHRMGELGRAHVIENYTWDKSLDIMTEAYRSISDA